jgi:hypothetical protein
MDLEDYIEPEIAVTAAVTAAICSPRARKMLRRGAVYGMAGALMAGDALSAFTRSISQGFQRAKSTSAQEGQVQQGQQPVPGMETQDSYRGSGSGSGLGSQKSAADGFGG